jgi:hypothetical protein
MAEYPTVQVADAVVIEPDWKAAALDLQREVLQYRRAIRLIVQAGEGARGEANQGVKISPTGIQNLRELLRHSAS